MTPVCYEFSRLISVTMAAPQNTCPGYNHRADVVAQPRYRKLCTTKMAAGKYHHCLGFFYAKELNTIGRMISEPGDPNRKVPVNETFHVQTDDELTEKELKQIEADDQAI
nr:hypothetical protein [Tanacetum cinerariifolium]